MPTMRAECLRHAAPGPHPSTKHQLCPRRSRCLTQRAAGRPLLRASGKDGPREGGPQDLLSSGCPVPRDQQPTNELDALQRRLFFDWVALPPPDFSLRLAALFCGAALLGLPVASASYSLDEQLLPCLLSASLGGILITTAVVLQWFIGYRHVGTRLLSAVLEYEESGWYDFRTWAKPQEMLARDRLLCNYRVKPLLGRLKRTLIGLGGALAATTLCLVLQPPQETLQAEMMPKGPGSTGQQSDYTERVRQYEPWSLPDGDAAKVAVPEDYMQRHMALLMEARELE